MKNSNLQLIQTYPLGWWLVKLKAFELRPAGDAAYADFYFEPIVNAEYGKETPGTYNNQVFCQSIYISKKGSNIFKRADKATPMYTGEQEIIFMLKTLIGEWFVLQEAVEHIFEMAAIVPFKQEDSELYHRVNDYMLDRFMYARFSITKNKPQVVMTSYTLPSSATLSQLKEAEVKFENKSEYYLKTSPAAKMLTKDQIKQLSSDIADIGTPRAESQTVTFSQLKNGYKLPENKVELIQLDDIPIDDLPF